MKILDTAIKKPRIEMMPLIDAFFLILVYFIYAFMSMSIHKGVPITLPQATTAKEQKFDHLGISITKEGLIFLDKQPITKDQLAKQLKDLYTENQDLNFYIYGDKQALHGVVIEVFDLVRKAGIKKIFIKTENVSE